MNRFRSCRPVLRTGPPASRASIKFLAEAFAVWCDQKSRLAAARATGLLDDESHDALADAYARTRELIGALLARAEAQRAARQGGPRSCAAWEGERTREPISMIEMDDGPEPPRARNCPAC